MVTPLIIALRSLQSILYIALENAFNKTFTINTTHTGLGSQFRLQFEESVYTASVSQDTLVTEEIVSVRASVSRFNNRSIKKRWRVEYGLRRHPYEEENIERLFHIEKHTGVLRLKEVNYLYTRI